MNGEAFHGNNVTPIYTTSHMCGIMSLIVVQLETSPSAQASQSVPGKCLGILESRSRS